MIQRPTLYVLADAAEIGLPEAATVPARAFDPVLRPFIKRNVLRAVDAASARTTSKHGDHVLRLAFLDFQGTAPKDLDPNDERAVEQAFHTHAAPFLPVREDPSKAPPRGGAYRETAADREPTKHVEAARKRHRWPITVPAVIVSLLAVVATLCLFFVPRLLPSPSARFRKTAFGKALGEPLTDVVVASSRGGNSDARGKLLTPDVKKQIGSDAYDSLTRVVDELPHVRGDGEESIDLALAPLYLEVNELDAKLAKASVPAHLHAYGSMSGGRPVVWLTSYFVENRDELTFEGQPVRFVWGRRIDGLNLSDNRLYKAHAEDWVIVSMDRVEEELVQTLLAAIAKGAPLAPDDAESEKSPRAEMSRTASRVVGGELVAVTKVSREDAESLHRAIAQRNEIAGSLAKLGYRFPATSGIELSASMVRRVTRAKDDNPRERALLEDFLRMNDRAMSYRRDVAPVVAALTRLEEEELGGYIVEQKRVGSADLPKLGSANHPRGRAAAAASLGMLARPQACPKLALWRLFGQLFDVDTFDRAAATASTLSLLNHLGLGKPMDVLLASDERDAFLRALTKALELPPERIRDAAAAAYTEIYGRPPPSFARKTLP